MPCIAFRDPLNGDIIPLEQAADHFEEHGIMPADVVQRMVDEIRGHKRRLTGLAPSYLEPNSNCRREIVAKRFTNFVQDPLAMFTAMEGNFFHWAMVESGKNLPQWAVKVQMPTVNDWISSQTTQGNGKVRRSPEAEGVYELEVFPGVWLTAESDRDNAHLGQPFDLVDHKTSRYSKTDFGPRNIPEWSVQLNVYRYMREDLTGVPAKALWVWRTYRGSYESSKTFRKFPIPMIPREKLWERIGEWVTSLQGFLAEAKRVREEGGPDAQQKLDALISTIPMDGKDKQMFGGQKCSKYCSVYDYCYGLAGLSVF